MTDYFALLSQSRRPWLEADALKERFLTLGTAAHPDRVHAGTEAERQAANQRFAELNAAHNCLREPRDRLRHLLELELGRKPTDLQDLPESLANLLMEAAALCREADTYLTRREAITSPLLRAQSFDATQDWIERLTAFQQRLRARQESLLSDLRGVDARWDEPDIRITLLPELEQISRGLGFFARWSQQIQERVNRLML